jgi:hypothetical protein
MAASSGQSWPRCCNAACDCDLPCSMTMLAAAAMSGSRYSRLPRWVRPARPGARPASAASSCSHAPWGWSAPRGSTSGDRRRSSHQMPPSSAAGSLPAFLPSTSKAAAGGGGGGGGGGASGGGAAFGARHAQQRAGRPRGSAAGQCGARTQSPIPAQERDKLAPLWPGACPGR